jgi:hypothetical protein
VTTWFHDVLLRFGYDLFEHEHPWDGEWIDDAFETAALDLRATGGKLLRALDAVHDDPETGPLSVDLCVAYLRRILDDIAVAIPNCYGVEGRSLPRGDLLALGFAPPVDLSFATHSLELYALLDGSATPVLPKAHDRAVRVSQALTRDAIAALDEALRVLCPWFDGLLDALQREVGKRAEDGEDLLERWADPSWSVLGPATDGARLHLPFVR